MENGPLALIHIEASSSISNSYPIEVYWSLDESEGAGYLINGDGIERWRTMERDFLARHLITNEDMRVHGTSPYDVCEQLNQRLKERIVYSESFQEHSRLLRELFLVGENHPQFALRSLPELLIAKLIEKGIGSQAAEAKLEALGIEAGDRAGRGGAFELRYLNRLWECVSEYRGS